MIKYTFREDDIVAIKNANRADPQRIGEALQKISEQNDGRLTPEQVVAAAKSNRHPLHKHLEWNDERAAHSWRLQQARQIINIVMVDTEDGETERAFISVNEKGRGRAYRDSITIKGDATLQLEVMRQAITDLKAFQTRYREMDHICDKIAIIEQDIQEMLAEKGEPVVAKP